MMIIGHDNYSRYFDSVLYIEAYRHMSAMKRQATLTAFLTTKKRYSRWPSLRRTEKIIIIFNCLAVA